MGQFLLIRHAKSSWSDLSLKDVERPLNKRGLNDAPKMAEHLVNLKTINLEYIYSSPANRALSTAKYFHKAFDLTLPIDVQMDIYHADEEDVLYIIKNTDASIKTFAIFGHNPTFTFLVNHFADFNIENLPTCGIAHFETSAGSWNDVDSDNTKLLNLILPKKTIY